MSTSTAEHDSYLVENWDTETLIDFLKKQNLKLDEKSTMIFFASKKLTARPFLS